MSDDELLDQRRAARRYLIEQFRKTGDRQFLTAAAQLETGSFDRASLLTLPRRRRGHPEVPGDHDRLLRMALLIDRGRAATPTEAATLIAQGEPEYMRDSIVHRLRTKFAQHRPYFTELVAVIRALGEPTPEVRAIATAMQQDEERRERIARALGLGRVGNSQN